jgi:hypothetical protein
MKKINVVKIAFLISCILVVSQKMMAQQNALPKVLFNADPIKKTAKSSPKFESKNSKGERIVGTTTMIVKDKNGKDKKITVEDYNKAMNEFQNYLNKKGYTLEDLESSQTPIFSNAILKKTDLLSIDKLKFDAIVKPAIITKSLQPSFFKRKSLPGLNIDVIPAHMLKKPSVQSFRTKTNKKISYNIAKKEFVLLETPFFKSIPNYAVTAPRINSYRKEIPFLRIGDDSDLAVSVNVTGTLEAKATAYPINKDAEDVTLADIEATNSTYEVKASIGANGKVGNTNINVFNLSTSYTAYANAATKHKNKIELLVGGQSFAIIPTEYADKTTSVSNNFSKEVEIPVIGCKVSILIGYVEFEAGIRGQVGFQVDGEMTPSSAALLVEPTAQCGLYARAAIGTGLDVPLIPFDIVTFKPFVQANLNFVDMKLTNYAEASLNWGQDWILNADGSSEGTIELLTGDLNAGVEISYPWPTFGGMIQVINTFQTNIWHSKGLRQFNHNFITSKDQPLVFTNW